MTFTITAEFEKSAEGRSNSFEVERLDHWDVNLISLHLIRNPR